MTFLLVEPRSLEEALEALADGDETTRPIAGGSGLALMMKYGFFQPEKLVSLRRLAHHLSGIQVMPDSGIEIGASSTLRDIEDSPDIMERLPVLHQTMKRLATIRLRNVAQLGGAIAHGAPQMDLPPVLIAVDAEVEVQSSRGQRWIAAKDIFLGYYETGIAPDELVTKVRVPHPGEHRGAYRKVTARSVDDWPLLGVAAVARFQDGVASRVTAAVGALGDHARAIETVETAMSGTRPTRQEIRSVAEEAADGMEYGEGGMASPRYQRQLVATNLRLALESVLTDEEGRG